MTCGYRGPTDFLQNAVECFQAMPFMKKWLPEVMEEGTSEGLPSVKLTVRPWKWAIPKKQASSIPTIHFQMLLSRRVMLSWITSYLSRSKRISMKNFQLPKFKQNHCRSNIRFKKRKTYPGDSWTSEKKRRKKLYSVLKLKSYLSSFEVKPPLKL